ncbi:MAG: DUF11 domain-containing protein [Chloroflexota bacterium]|nr:DUF11 domain-containing protein [Chloroflexota bacterium]
MRFEDAFPDGTGERGLLPGLALEVWGLPVSGPTRDPGLPDAVYLRWERGVMAFDARTGQVETVPLGEAFRSVLTGENVPSDLLAGARSSPFYAQFQPNALHAIARPDALPDSSLTGAFQVGSSAYFTSAAAQPYGTPTPYGAPAYDPYATPTSTPVGGSFTAGTPIPWGTTGTGQPPASISSGTGSVDSSGITSSGGLTTNPATTPVVDVCHGDEQITYAPAEPRVGNDLLIAVSSARPHPYGRLAGTEPTQFQRERSGQLGLVWEWIVKPTYPGKHKYTFYVDSTIPCKEIELTVLNALATATPRPTRTPTPYGWDDNDNGSDNGDDNDNGGSSDSGADVAVSLTGPPSVSAGQEIVYSASVYNSGPENVDSLTLTANVSGPSSVTVVGVSASNGSCSPGVPTNAFSCNLGRLDRYTSTTVTLTVRVPQGVGASSFTVGVGANSSRSDPNFSNNNSSTTTSVGTSSFTEPGSGAGGRLALGPSEPLARSSMQ